MKLIDTHCRLFLDPLARDVEGVRLRAGNAGVHEVVVPARDVESWPAIAELCRLEGVHPALGLHPCAANQGSTMSEFHDRLATAIQECRAVAVGEIGLDFMIQQPTPSQQVAVLKSQLALAADLDLPVILHCRNGWEMLVAALQPFAGRLRGVLHSYTRHPELARPFLKCGFFVGFGGAITQTQAKRARFSAETLPLDRIILETDAPLTGMAGLDPGQTEPRHVQNVAQTLAGIRQTTIEQIAAVTTGNARELFRI
jgi:TatD DNase family protein